jgi:hypothetical protein
VSGTSASPGEAGGTSQPDTATDVLLDQMKLVWSEQWDSSNRMNTKASAVTTLAGGALAATMTVALVGGPFALVVRLIAIGILALAVAYGTRVVVAHAFQLPPDLSISTVIGMTALPVATVKGALLSEYVKCCAANHLSLDWMVGRINLSTYLTLAGILALAASFLVGKPPL